MLLIKRRLVVLGLDIETHGKLGKEVTTTDINDKTKCICASLFWLYEDKPFLKVAYCYDYTPKDTVNNIETVNAYSIPELLMNFAEIFRDMKPDYCIGFNDGEYDWPKLIHSLKEYKDNTGRDLIFSWFGIASCYISKDISKMTDKDISGYIYPKRFKLDADTTLNSRLFNLPGCIMLDIRNILRKRYKSEKTNLDTFLMLNSLPLKLKMSIRRMFYIYDEGDRLNELLIVKSLKKSSIDFVNNLYKIRRDQYDKAIKDKELEFEFINDKINVKRDKIIEYVKLMFKDHMENPSVKLILENIETVIDYIDYLIGCSDIREYCDLDAESCVKLFHKNFIYSDAAEMASLDNISLQDCYWKADGMKVINFICKYANDDNLLIDLLHQESSEDAKYPGAYVIYTKRGQYKFKPEYFQEQTEQNLNLIKEELEKNIKTNRITFEQSEQSNQSCKLSIEEFKNNSETDGDLKDLLLKLQEIRNSLRTKNRITVDKIIDFILQNADSNFNEFTNENKAKFNEIMKFIEYLVSLGLSIVALDFASLYPNIIRTYNLSPEYIIRCPKKAKKYMDKGYKLHEISFKYGTRDVLAWSLIADPNGVRYEGIYGKILGDLFNLRLEVKAILKKYPIEDMRNAGKEGTDEYNECAFYYNLYDGKQKAIKVIMNTLYGKAGDKKAAIFMCEIAGGTTSGGQYNLILVYHYITRNKTEDQLKVLSDVICKDLLKNATKNYNNILDCIVKPCKDQNKFIKDYTENKHYIYTDNVINERVYNIYDVNYDSLVQGNENNVAFVNALNEYIYVLYLLTVYEENRGGHVKVIYGDTDSLYNQFIMRFYQYIFDLCIINKYDILDTNDVDYETKRRKIIDEYSYFKVLTTMKIIDFLKYDVAMMLIEDNGTKYLEMGYEEVLDPAGFIMKKKYYGIPHVNKIMFHGYKRFDRGMLPGKKGYSTFAKEIVSKILKTSLDIYDEKPIINIVEDALTEIFNTPQKIEDFVQSAAYKPNRKNTKVITFIKRMNDLLMDEPLPYSRFQYVIVKKYPFKYDIKGCKKNISVGDKMEYLDVAKKNNYEIDIFHYVNKSLLAELAAIISMDYRFFVEPKSTDEEDVKGAYLESLNLAKKYLDDFIDSYMIKYTVKQGHLYKQIYKEIYTRIMNSNRIEKSIKHDFNFLFNINYDTDPMEKLIKNIYKKAKDEVKNTMKDVIKIYTLDRERAKSLKTNNYYNTTEEQKKFMENGIQSANYILKTIEESTREVIKQSETDLYMYKDLYVNLYNKYVDFIKIRIEGVRNSLDILNDNDINENHYKKIYEEISKINFYNIMDNEDLININILIEKYNMLKQKIKELYRPTCQIELFNKYMDKLINTV
jgi:DNA polymerase elongation subunit (family B)